MVHTKRSALTSAQRLKPSMMNLADVYVRHNPSGQRNIFVSSCAQIYVRNFSTRITPKPL